MPLLQRIDQALGEEEESLTPVQPVAAYLERLPCLEPITTRTGVEAALQQLLASLCDRLRQEKKGLRTAVFQGYRTDRKTVGIEVKTSRHTADAGHLFKLFQLKLPVFEPGDGIELFTLEAMGVEAVSPTQEKIWEHATGVENKLLAELLDRIAGKTGPNAIHRYLPD